jgi:DNA replicative helicase MCM subunit Mcm2 (Cdc46/Mcm family)
MQGRITEKRKLPGATSNFQGHIYYALFYCSRRLHMPALHHVCNECDSEFTIKYQEDKTESDPTYCPFCGEYLIETEERIDDDD